MLSAGRDACASFALMKILGSHHPNAEIAVARGVRVRGFHGHQHLTGRPRRQQDCPTQGARCREFCSRLSRPARLSPSAKPNASVASFLPRKPPPDSWSSTPSRPSPTAVAAIAPSATALRPTSKNKCSPQTKTTDLDSLTKPQKPSPRFRRMIRTQATRRCRRKLRRGNDRNRPARPRAWIEEKAARAFIALERDALE